MTEQATLTPEEAIMAVTSAVCPTCKGYLRGQTHDQLGGGEVSEPYDIDCDACLDADGKPTGRRFPTLQVRCPSETHDPCSKEFGYDTPEASGYYETIVIPSCQGRRWTPVSPDDWKTITKALEADGFPVRYLDGQWNVSHPGTDRFPRDGCAELAIAADRAIKADASNEDLG